MNLLDRLRHRALTLASFVAVVSGSWFVWGGGGALFGLGLWLLTAVAAESMERAIERSKS